MMGWTAACTRIVIFFLVYELPALMHPSLSPLIFHFTLDQASEMNLEEANTGTGDYNFSIIWRAGVLEEIGISVTCCRCDKRPAWLSLAPRRIKALEEVIFDQRENAL